jgi:hypothetical protein
MKCRMLCYGGVHLSNGLALAGPAGSPLAGGVLVMNGSLEDSLAVTAASRLLLMGGSRQASGTGRRATW